MEPVRVRWFVDHRKHLGEGVGVGADFADRHRRRARGMGQPIGRNMWGPGQSLSPGEGRGVVCSSAATAASN